MPTTAEILLADLEKAAEGLLLQGSHEGDCTNKSQMSILPKIAPCTKHAALFAARKAKFEDALKQFKLLREFF